MCEQEIRFFAVDSRNHNAKELVKTLEEYSIDLHTSQILVPKEHTQYFFRNDLYLYARLMRLVWLA